MKFTMQSAMEAAAKQNIENWVHEFLLTEGNHHYEALVRSGIKDFPVVIWVTGSQDLREFEQKYGDA